MHQISFNVPDRPAMNKALNSLGKLSFVSDIKVKQLDSGLIPPEKEAELVNDLLMDWSDMEEPVQDFRKMLWQKKSF